MLKITFKFTSDEKTCTTKIDRIVPKDTSKATKEELETANIVLQEFDRAIEKLSKMNF